MPIGQAVRLVVASLGIWIAATASCLAQEGTRYIRNWGPGSPVIIFLHGVLGDSTSTWTNGKAYWPDLIAGDDAFAGASIYVDEYNTKLFEGGLTIDELADDLKVRLNSLGVTQHRKLIFITHSMGGLVARALLLKYRDLAEKTQFMFLLATPTSGAAIATWAALVSRNPQFSNMKLMASSDYLADMHRTWIGAGFATRIASYCAYETRSTHLGLFHNERVVDMASAASLCNRPPLLAIEVDHIGIAKPANRKARQYEAFKNAFEIEATVSKMSLVDSGKSELEAKQWERAIKYFDEALRLDPKYLPAISYRAAANLGKKDWDAAIKDYDKAIQFEPEYAEHFYNRGVSYLGRTDLDKAIADLTTAINLNFYDKALAMYFRGEAKRLKGDSASAQADLAEARTIDPKIDERASR